MTRIDPDLLKESFIKASLHLERNHKVLNNLNVFPVPDGDTGSNMSSSLKAAVSGLEKENPLTLPDIARIFCEELNRNSRGNSGFILARFFAGFFDVSAGNEAITTKDLREGFSQGSFLVNTSLFSPTEGTMITIIAAMTEYMSTVDATDVRELFRGALETARAALENTPRDLPILAQAGVIDSGALGFIVLFEGFLAALTGIEPQAEIEADYRFPPQAGTPDSSPEEAGFRFCTELLVRLEKDIPDGELRDFLKERGNSIALVAEGELLKLHIHTNDPEDLEQYLSAYGRIEKTKIEDMQDQVNLFNKKAEATDNAVLVCIPGSGFAEIFRNLGAEYSVSYDEKLPSARELGEQLQQINNDHIIIITNNKNIIPAAIMARDECDKAVSILPTETVSAGIAAMYGFSENDTIAENARNMQDCLEFVQSFSLFKSTMDTRFGDVDIVRGNFFTISGGKILAVGKSSDQVLKKSFSGYDLSMTGNISLFKGSRFDESSLPDLKQFLLEQNSTLEIEEFYGGQYREELIVSLE
ncbi:MAG: DAK2 domain-containing protein [Spirochaetales bacterium]|nr:DAK2 domain-containing protein [Spirochaetales bacterium]